MRPRVSVVGIGSRLGVGVVERLLARAARLRTLGAAGHTASAFGRGSEEEEAVAGLRQSDDTFGG